MLGENCFTCIFDSLEERDKILMEGPWYVGGQVVGLDRWSVSFSPDSLEGLSAPVWIRLPQLPLLYWDNVNLARIASMVGRPLWIDAQSRSWGRCAFAWVCVRLDFSKVLPKGVWILGVNGRFFQPVEYEGLTSICFNCGLVGHKDNQCKENLSVKAGVMKEKPVAEGAFEMGFNKGLMGGMWNSGVQRSQNAVATPPVKRMDPFFRDTKKVADLKGKAPVSEGEVPVVMPSGGEKG